MNSDSEYEFRYSAVRVDKTVGKKFNVKVGVHQGSVLGTLMFIMVLEALSREFRSANDLAIIAEHLVKLEERYLTWKSNIENKCLKVNIGKIKKMEMWHK